MDSYESVLLVKNEVFVFKIPPMTTNRGHKAADWNLNEPQWTGRMRLVSKDKEVYLKLEDKTSGELFAKCPIDKYPGVAIQPVSDSSRYFVLRIQDDNGRTAFIGVGFSDRSDSFDLNVALQDHFNWLKKSEEIEKEKDVPKPELDLRFKDGETIKINMKITKKDGSEATSKPKARSSGAGLLPPPPGGVKIAPPPAPSVNSSPSHAAPSTKPESWGEFASAPSPGGATTPSNPNWVQF
ncbi:hypothetical protein O3M35_012309 [Rhynocoris fuscipes]|uniref:NECAP PHear domain-containing protein n=2 Tax=Rhynocoris fuscipes TaxID=488301 RepID=A0AAW1CVG6_9HEMI